MSVSRVALGLARACHAGPTFVVTTAITAVAASLGRTGVGLVAVALAVLLGQLSVGWSNDVVDAGVDTAAQRTEKPIVAGLVTVRLVRISAYVAAGLCVPASYLAAGRIGGTAHVVAVASAWIYNLWLKKTLFSVLPYVVSFGLVAPFLTYGLSPPTPPASWFVVTLASLGLAAGMANGIPDIDGDLGVNAGGFVARIGARTSALLAAVGVMLASVLLVLHLQLARVASIGFLAPLAAITIGAALVAGGRRLFSVVLVVALVDTALLCFVGASSVVR